MPGAGSGGVAGGVAGVDDEDPPGEGEASANLTAARFRPGKSGNPGGRPKDLPRFRKACGKRGWRWLATLDALMDSPATTPADKLAIWRAVCDRGGLLPADRQAAIDGHNARLLVLAAALRNLSVAQREQILSMLGDVKAPASP